MPRLDPDSLTADLDPEQREAVLATSGPVVILAGAGSGKTRVISRRTAYAIATDVVPPDQALVVTFTEKAAGEMVERLRILGLPGVTARTFHAHARSQLRHFWPSRHDGNPMPELLDSKMPIIGRLARSLPGHYRFKPAKDLADEIEWAKSRRFTPATYADAGRTPPIPEDLFVRLFAGYESAKHTANRIDFDDLLIETIALLESDPDAAATVRSRKRWFSVDEYQDTSPLQQRVLELWLGESRDLCVVGDEDQTIYTFTGATSAYLTGFKRRWPGAREIALVRNYRSTPQVLELANRLIAAEGRDKRLVASREDGPVPVQAAHRDPDAELAALVNWIRARIEEGIAPAEVAVLTRLNAQLEPVAERLTRAGIPHQVRGQGFWQRQEVRGAVMALRRKPVIESTGLALAAETHARWAEAVGYLADPEAVDALEGDEARERQASLEILAGILEDLVRALPSLDAQRLITELDARADQERHGAADGVNLLTIHRAKGLEWDAVALPSVEEGYLPVRQAKTDEAIAEERRLLYVGLTRARTHLLLSWAANRKSSRFLADMRPPRPAPGSQIRELPGPPAQVKPQRRGASGDPVFEALREWRSERARVEAVPPYIIAHDATLVAIAEAHPRTLPGLRRVKGMGDAKIEKYGDEIIALVAAHVGGAPRG